MTVVVERIACRAPARALRVSVAIPACNEAENLSRCIEALNDQVNCSPEDYEVLLLLNACRDASEAVALAAARRFPALRLSIMRARLPASLRHVGGARRAAMDISCSRLRLSARSDTIVATTDADTIVAADWVAAMLREFDAGADCVAGDIAVAAGELARLPPALRRILTLDRLYNLLKAELEALVVPDRRDPSPRHSHQTGASLALRAALYRALGGLPPLPSQEDTALVAAVRRGGWAIRHSLNVRVMTSARLGGRAQGGMADTLAEWLKTMAEGGTIRTESAASLERRWLAGASNADVPPHEIDLAEAITSIVIRIAALQEEKALGQSHPDDRIVPQPSDDVSGSPTSFG